ncbi:hypothetical protein B0H17DRAFT_1125201 [Mycena rosella]|uniref:Uncharacterized protein n=1 Tax=Mycena rosella TaxID=1033263 RepID=A0AAD7M9U3_MYCRO|nr:hypothetical protein B0H17DRAFT_1125201 [Mycena rosella]
MQLSLLADVWSPSSLSFLAALDTKLTLIISETSDHCVLMREVCQQVWQPNFPATTGSTQPPIDQHPSTKGQKCNTSKRIKKESARKELKVEAELLGSALEPEEREYNCPNCRDLPADDECLCWMEVFKRTDMESLIGAALTCALPDDRLSPCTPSTKHGDTESDVPMKSTQYQVKYVNPEEIDLRWVKPRLETQEHCNGESLGGVRYNMMQPKLLECLIDNHQRVKLRGVHRREAMQAWSTYGSMTAAGTCQVQGGAKGDVYGPYACHSGDTADDIKALFCHATDTNVMVKIGSTIVSGLRSDMIAVTNAAEVSCLGRHRLTNYYCSSYISTVHRDFNVGRHNLKQKEKGKKKQEDGIMIETHSNTVWCFNGWHKHGSVIPSRSSYEANAASSGYHPTKSKQDVDCAEVFQQIRLGIELRPHV